MTGSWLGTYRQSRHTGRWFAGPHSLHVVGNGVCSRPFCEYAETEDPEMFSTGRGR